MSCLSWGGGHEHKTGKLSAGFSNMLCVNERNQSLTGCLTTSILAPTVSLVISAMVI